VAGKDQGHRISVQVTGTKSGFAPTSRTSAAVMIHRALTATPRPTISGKAKVGGTLTAVPHTWAPKKVTLSYHWYRNGKEIHGATSATYTLTTRDRGATITVKVTGKKKGYLTETVRSRGVRIT